MPFAYRNTDMVKVWNLERSHEHTGGWRQKVFHRCGCSLTFDNIWYKMTGVFLWKDSTFFILAGQGKLKTSSWEIHQCGQVKDKTSVKLVASWGSWSCTNHSQFTSIWEQLIQLKVKNVSDWGENIHSGLAGHVTGSLGTGVLEEGTSLSMSPECTVRKTRGSPTPQP